MREITGRALNEPTRLAVHVWTVNDADTMNSLLDLGADGIMTDQTELLRKVMIDRGQWNPRAGAGESET